jgi:hypothetical protein
MQNRAMAGRTRRVDLPRRNGVKAGAVRSRKKTLFREEIHALRGSLKCKPGDKSFAEWWADHKRAERELEEREFRRLAALGKRSIIHRIVW